MGRILQRKAWPWHIGQWLLARSHSIEIRNDIWGKNRFGVLIAIETEIWSGRDSTLSRLKLEMDTTGTFLSLHHFYIQNNLPILNTTTYFL